MSLKFEATREWRRLNPKRTRDGDSLPRKFFGFAVGAFCQYISPVRMVFWFTKRWVRGLFGVRR